MNFATVLLRQQKLIPLFQECGEDLKAHMQGELWAQLQTFTFPPMVFRLPAGRETAAHGAMSEQPSMHRPRQCSALEAPGR